MSARLKSLADFKQLELNALLEITQAINSNASEEHLYKIYHFTLRANLIIKKIALFVMEENKWVCKLHFGCREVITQADPSTIDCRNNQITEIRHTDLTVAFSDFDVAIPVAHKNQLLAYVFVDGDESFGEEAKSQKFKFIQTLSNILLVAIENKRFSRKQIEQETLKKELEIAAQVQAMLIPNQLPDTNLFQLYATYFPHQTIGGDYYDYIPLDNHRFYVCIADVSGKGIPAAIFMSNFQATLRTLISQGLELKEIISKINYLTQKNTGGDYFVTFFMALVNLIDMKLHYINAGHNAPLFLRGNKDLELLEKGTVIIGAFQELPFLEEGSVNLEKGDLLFMYTDGLVETTNDHFVEFGEEAVEKAVLDHIGKSVPTLHNQLIASLDMHKGDAQKYKDDVTLYSLLVK